MNLSTLVSVIVAAGSLLPSVSTLVKDVESAFPAGSSGATKLAAVEAGLEAAYSKLEGIEAAFTDVWPVLQAQVTALVTAYNALGIFKHGATAAMPPATT